jgi:hypothetical protein
MCSMSVHYIIYKKNFKHQRMHKEFFLQAETTKSSRLHKRRSAQSTAHSR